MDKTNQPNSALEASEPGQKQPVPSGAEAYARWLDHMQRMRTRHAAITRELGSWSNYKSWAEKMRHDWDSGENKG